MYYNYNFMSSFTPDKTDNTGENLSAKQTQHVQRSQVSTILRLLQSACWSIIGQNTEP